jgi:acetyl-CoA synthetase
MDEYKRLWKQSIDEPEKFWSGIAGELDWAQPWDKVLDWKVPDAKWFVGGKTERIRQLRRPPRRRRRGDKVALLWEGEPEKTPGGGGEVRRITYAELSDLVGAFASGLKKIGVAKGDVVTIYMPLVPEAIIAMLACAHIGAPHSVVFGGFSSQAIADRVGDAKSKFVITADGGYRRGQPVPLKKNVDEALKVATGVKNVIVLKRTGDPVDMHAGRDLWWHDVVGGQASACPAEPIDSEDPLFVLYTSGSTGKPKGIQHTTAATWSART